MLLMEISERKRSLGGTKCRRVEILRWMDLGETGWGGVA
jgi:hypothetical protein